jgi:uncharacterized protein YcnI
MRLRLFVVLMVAALAITSLSAHVTVSPLQSKNGGVQKYELRVHNEVRDSTCGAVCLAGNRRRVSRSDRGGGGGPGSGRAGA